MLREADDVGMGGLMRFFAGVSGLLLWISLSCEFAFALEKPSFECASAARTIERAICGDQTLIDLDGRIGQLYRQALRLTTNRQQVIDGQRQWITQRNTNCEKVAAGQFYECIVRYENERIQALSAAITTMNKNAAAARPNPTGPSPASTANPPPPATEKMTGLLLRLLSSVRPLSRRSVQITKEGWSATG
jgi:uncharacterized protein